MDYFALLVSVGALWALAVVTPGPNMWLTVTVALRASRTAALMSVFGICSGTFVWALAAAFGITALFVIAPWAFWSIKLVGGCYLIYLGSKMLYGALKPSNRKQLDRAHVQHSYKYYYCQGFITNLTNPKTAIFIASMLAAAMPAHVSVSLGIAEVAVMVLLSLCWYSAVACLFSLSAFKRGYLKVSCLFESLAGAALMGFGVHLIASKR
ncbi:LysE family translocator [Celerinatantimonas sp. MCCC 1A17872]|uniref:LysE family translocator n=1 Tax=Celerinatantimonas sp. MCCC 1A17872 TaxID=3177514 RepID=UPI0038CAEDE6